MSSIIVNDIQRKPIKRGGVVHQFGSLHSQDLYNAEIQPGKSIRIYGTSQGKPYDMTFKLGDYAEYDSYNLSYTGEIVAIAAKTVTIKERDGRNHRLDLHTFSWRNHNYDANEIAEDNARTMMYI